MSLHIPGSMCVGVTLWFGCGGVVSVCRLRRCWSVRVEYGVWGLMTRLEQGFGFSWAVLRNEFAFMVEGLDIVFSVRQE